MIGQGLLVARGFITLDELRDRLSDPTIRLDPALVENPKLRKAPPGGLSYVGGEYDPAMFEGQTDDLRKLPVGPTPLEHNWRPKIDWHDDKLSRRLMALTDPESEVWTPLPTKANECKQILQKCQQQAELD